MKELMDVLTANKIPYWIKDHQIAVPYQAMALLTALELQDVSVSFELHELWILDDFYEKELTEKDDQMALICWQTILDVIEYEEGMIMPNTMDELIEQVQKKQHCSTMQARSWIVFVLKARIINHDIVSTGIDALDQKIQGFCKTDVICVIAKQEVPFWKMESDLDVQTAKQLAKNQHRPVLLHKEKLSREVWKADMVIILQSPCISELWCFVVKNNHGELCEVLIRI